MKVMKTQITEAAHCLLGICDDWGYFDIEQFLDWQLDNMDEIAEGYPMEVMKRKYERDIMLEVEKILSNRLSR